MLKKYSTRLYLYSVLVLLSLGLGLLADNLHSDLWYFIAVSSVALVATCALIDECRERKQYWTSRWKDLQEKNEDLRQQLLADYRGCIQSGLPISRHSIFCPAAPDDLRIPELPAGPCECGLVEYHPKEIL